MKLRLLRAQALAEVSPLEGSEMAGGGWFATPEEAVNDLFAQDCGGVLPPRLAQELRPARVHVHCLDLDSWTDGDAGDDGA